MEFKLSAKYKPSGDQPEAIAQILERVAENKNSTLKGITGSGKTFTVANVIAQLDRPTLVLSHNKTLAAQLYSEFKNFFPDNAVEYFVSYYDYYQPEAYLPTKDIYIEKDMSINEEIEKLRLSATSTLLSGRRDVIVVASVSCIYGLGNPEDFEATSIKLKVGDKITSMALLYMLAEALYTRDDNITKLGTFRVKGEHVDILTAYGGGCYRIIIVKNKITEICSIDPTSGIRIAPLEEIKITPANIFVTTKERIGEAIGKIYVDMGKQVERFEREGRMVEAQRLKQRVEYDLEMIKELGYCSGIENYSRYFDKRSPGEAPFCLLDYFPEDFITVVDESHVMIPQIKAMYGGDSARKDNLVEYGFRLESARDNRPLKIKEFEEKTKTTIYVSATPSEYEIKRSGDTYIDQLIRPTGLLDPSISVRPTENMADDLLEEIHKETKAGNKILVLAITKRMAEEMATFFERTGVRNRYIHSDIDTMERVNILNDLRQDMYDVLVGVNLLREGLDLPEVSLVVILDADKDGFLRNANSLIQIAGRAARNPEGRVIMYANRVTDSILAAVELSCVHRLKQIEYNVEHNLAPRPAEKSGNGKFTLATSRVADDKIVVYPTREDHYAPIAADTKGTYYATKHSSQLSLDELITEAKEAMEQCAKAMNFKEAVKHRSKMHELIKVRDKKG